MRNKTPQYYFFVALIIVSATLSYFIFRPFLIVLALAAIFAVVLQPLYRGIARHLHSFPGLAASVTILIAVVCIVGPLTFIAFQIVDEAQQLYVSSLSTESDQYAAAFFREVNNSLGYYAPSLVVSEADLSIAIDQYSKDALAWALRNIGGAFGGVAHAFLSFFVFVIALYYLLRDGVKLKKLIIDTSPLSSADDEIVFSRLETAVNSVIRGSLTIAFVQGVLTALGFTLFGVPNAVLWGTVAAFAALIPGIGTALVLAPAVVYLFFFGSTVSAIGLLIWGVAAVGLIDNLLGPKLMGKGMELHPLVVLLSVLGGLAFFGAAGLFIGPLCVSLLFALLSMLPQVSERADPKAST